MDGNGDFQPFPISKDFESSNWNIHKELVGFGVPCIYTNLQFGQIEI